MITLFRWFLLKQKKIKWELAFWQFLDQQVTSLIKDPELLAKKLLPYITEAIANSKQDDKTGIS